MLQPDEQTDVETYREVRLRSLLTDPGAFASTHEREVEFTADDWRRRIAGFSGKPGVTFVDEVDGRVTGTVAVGYTEWDPNPMLVAMWVDPTARGQGVGTRLVEAAVNWAIEQAAAEIILWVVRDNDGAISLYRRCGFEPTGVVDTLPNNPCVDELEMRRTL
jgi:GNAT superfamily N-acetyltransferase